MLLPTIKGCTLWDGNRTRSDATFIRKEEADVTTARPDSAQTGWAVSPRSALQGLRLGTTGRPAAIFGNKKGEMCTARDATSRLFRGLCDGHLNPKLSKSRGI